jgi:protein O-mannosyl-transferase
LRARKQAMSPQQTPWRNQVLIAVLLFTGVLLVFGRSLRWEFVQWDDDINVYENARIQSLNAESLAWMFSDLQQALRYKPLSWLTWAALRSVFGLKPAAFHAANLLFHALNAVLAFFVVQRLLRMINPRADSMSNARLLVPSTIAALLWSLHPMRAEPVAWVTGLPYCQSVFFALLSFWCYLGAHQSPAGFPRHKRFYWMSVGWFALSLLTYPIVLGFAGVLIVTDHFLIRPMNPAPEGNQSPSGSRLWLEKLPFITLTVLFLSLALYGRIHASGIWAKPEHAQGLSLAGKLTQSTYVWAYYLGKPWAPFHLSPIYTALVSFQPQDWPFVGSLLLVTILTIVFLWQRKRWPFICALWLCHLGLLVPVLGLTEHPHYTSDRYHYFAGILWPIWIAYALAKAWPRAGLRAASCALATGVVLILGGMSFRQTFIWKDSETLFRSMLSRLGSVPISGQIHRRLADVLLNHGRVNEAWNEMTSAEKVDANHPDTQAGLAILLVIQNRAPEAIKHYRLALGLKPDWPETLNNLAWLLATHPDDTLRDGAEAVRLAERACQLTSGKDPMLLGTLAAAYAETGRFAEAIVIGERARTLATAMGLSDVAAKNAQLIENYRAGKPVRETP